MKRDIKPILPKISPDSETLPELEEVSVSEKETSSFKPKKKCSFCASKTDPIYTDVTTLRRFMTDRARIVPKEKSGVCSKHQRRVTKEIKHARFLSLLPFTPRV